MSLSTAGTGSEKTVIEGNLALKEQQLTNLIDFVKGGSKRGIHESLKLEAEIDELKQRLRTYIEPAPLQDVVEVAVMHLQALNRAKDDQKNEMRRAMRASMQRLVERIDFLAVEHKQKPRDVEVFSGGWKVLGEREGEENWRFAQVTLAKGLVVKPQSMSDITMGQLPDLDLPFAKTVLKGRTVQVVPYRSAPKGFQKGNKNGKRS